MIYRQAAFRTPGKFLKGGLHCHTTRSDGKGDPAEVIRLHKANGYDFLAVTDHRLYNYRNFAPETDITIVPGMEFDSTFQREKGFRCFHTVSVGPDDGTNGFAQDQRFESGRSTCQEEYQPYLDWLHENNNMTIYCHPQWSSTPARYFEKLQGNFAMEIWNSGCVLDCDMDDNAAYWDELLGQGIRIFGVAADDGHGMHQHCNGWVMVRSENKVTAILEALKNGEFYASCGPEIQDFWVEDDAVHVKCSECVQIEVLADCHPTRVRKGEALTEATIPLNGWGEDYSYVRVCVMDKNGKRAWTNPIWPEEE